MRVLSIDGGGIRGLIPAVVLAEIERRTKQPVCRLFDMIAGTSTGGILACALSRPSFPGSGEPMFSAEELCGLYETEGPRIFSRTLLKRLTSLGGLVDERYEDDGLRAALEQYLGDARLSDALTPILVTAYELHNRFAFFFRTERARVDETHDFTLVDAAHATAAAPTYFPPVEVTDVAGDRTYALIDGGVYATNPAMCAYAELGRSGHVSEISMLLSLGTGAQQRPLDVDDVRGWGQLQWARPILDVVFDGVADTIDFQLAQLLPLGRYVRLQTELTLANDNMDDASPENLKRLREEGERLVARSSAAIDDVCAKLTGA